MNFRSLGLAIGGVCIVCLSVSNNAWFETRAQSQDEAGSVKRFVGIWRLVSWQQRLADGTTRLSPLSVGYIIYTDTNRMCYVNMDPNRPKWNLGGKAFALGYTPTPEEATSGISGLGAYCATVEVHV